MRRTLASLLLVLVSYTLIAPALLADAASMLPACCRRDGKHHCAMMDPGQPSQDGPGLSALRMKCPSFPKGVTTRPPSVVPAVAGLNQAQRIDSWTALSAIENVPSAFFLHSPHKRGPPRQIL
jgi:hypothetical protein